MFAPGSESANLTNSTKESFSHVRFSTLMKVRENPIETANYNFQLPFLFPGEEKFENRDILSQSSKGYDTNLKVPAMPRQLKLGMVVHSDFRQSRLVSSLAKPGSSCSLVDFVVLDGPSQCEMNDIESSLRKNILKAHQGATIRLGEAGFEEILKSDLHAVYIYVPAE